MADEMEGIEEPTRQRQGERNSATAVAVVLTATAAKFHPPPPAVT